MSYMYSSALGAWFQRALGLGCAAEGRLDETQRICHYTSLRLLPVLVLARVLGSLHDVHFVLLASRCLRPRRIHRYLAALLVLLPAAARAHLVRLLRGRSRWGGRRGFILQ